MPDLQHFLNLSIGRRLRYPTFPATCLSTCKTTLPPSSIPYAPLPTTSHCWRAAPGASAPLRASRLPRCCAAPAACPCYAAPASTLLPPNLLTLTQHSKARRINLWFWLITVVIYCCGVVTFVRSSSLVQHARAQHARDRNSSRCLDWLRDQVRRAAEHSPTFKLACACAFRMAIQRYSEHGAVVRARLHDATLH